MIAFSHRCHLPCCALPSKAIAAMPDCIVAGAHVHTVLQACNKGAFGNGYICQRGRASAAANLDCDRGARAGSPQPLGLSYTVPHDRTAGMFYFRAGSSVSGMVNISVMRDSRLMRYFRLRRTAQSMFRWRLWKNCQPVRNRHPRRCRRLGHADPRYWISGGMTSDE